MAAAPRALGGDALPRPALVGPGRPASAARMPSHPLPPVWSSPRGVASRESAWQPTSDAADAGVFRTRGTAGRGARPSNALPRRDPHRAGHGRWRPAHAPVRSVFGRPPPREEALPAILSLNPVLWRTAGGARREPEGVCFWRPSRRTSPLGGAFIGRRSQRASSRGCRPEGSASSFLPGIPLAGLRRAAGVREGCVSGDAPGVPVTRPSSRGKRREIPRRKQFAEMKRGKIQISGQGGGAARRDGVGRHAARPDCVEGDSAVRDDDRLRVTER